MIFGQGMFMADSCMLGAALMGIVAVLAMRAAYRNGCEDGYGYAKEPWNPGYKEAKWILEKKQKQEPDADGYMEEHNEWD